MKKLLILISLVLPLTAAAQIDIDIDARHPAADISQMLYGIFYEDINHAADGGIYAELVRNRSFEDNPTEPEAWKPYLSVSGNVKMTLVGDGLLNQAQGRALRVVTTGIGDTDAGVMNNGFWGISTVKGQSYRLSLWIKVTRSRGFFAMLKGKRGVKFHSSVKLNVDLTKTGWQHVTATLTSTANDPDAQLVISSKGNSDFCLDVVSLFPPTYNDRDNGLRPDLVEMLHNLHPRFMRFPGGCFVEGQDTPDNAFRWHRTVGPIEQRPGHWNKNWGYRTTDGLGFHEYLQLAEDLGAKPLYVVNVGIWHGGVTPLDSLRMWVDECMNALEYANGAVTTKYGAMRAANGHPEPFCIEYVEIGNENNQSDGAQTSDNYYARYRAFRTAILRKYPKMHIIGNVAAWGTDNPRWESKDKVELVDEHYYRSPAWFASNFAKYDSYSRSWPEVYCGEYAVTQNYGHVGNLNAALGEAVFMMGMENNGDMVRLSSYAPIFVNVNDQRWMPDMIRFNATSVVGTPSYHVQKIMSDNLPTRALKVTRGAQTLFPANDIYTPDSSYVGIATWNTNATFKDIMMRAGDYTVFTTATKAQDITVRSMGWTFGKDGATQHDIAENQSALVNVPIGGRKYTVTMRARKNSGDEGFMLMFNYADNDNYCWLNLGGWQNTNHGIEQVCQGGQTVLCQTHGRIETGRWYDVRLEVDGNHLQAFLDDEKVADTYLRGATVPGVFASAALDDDTGEMVVKIVNTSRQRENATLHLNGFRADGAELTQLKAPKGEAENTLEAPTNVYPTHRHISLQGEKPQFVVEPFSLNVLRMKPAKQ